MKTTGGGGMDTAAQRFADPWLADGLEQARERRTVGHGRAPTADTHDRTPRSVLAGQAGDAAATGYTGAVGEDTLALLSDLSERRTLAGDPSWVMGFGRIPDRDVWGRPRGETLRYSLRALQIAIAYGWVETREPDGDVYRITAAGLAALEGAS